MSTKASLCRQTKGTALGLVLVLLSKLVCLVSGWVRAGFLEGLGFRSGSAVGV